MFENRVLRRIFGPKRDEVTVKIVEEEEEEDHLPSGLISISYLIPSSKVIVKLFHDFS
jgi:hypothetical protein